MTPRATRLVVLLVVAVLLAGCGTPAPAQPTTAPAPPAKAPAQPTAAAAPAAPKPAAASSPAAAPQPTAAPKVGGKVRVGLSFTGVFEFLPSQVGSDFGIFQKHGLDVEVITFNGDAPMQQALASNGVDIGLGSATSAMGAMSKGVPTTMLAEISASPRVMTIIGSTAQGIKTVDDLKGKKVGVTSAGSFTEFVVRKLNQTKGWTGSDAALAVALGGPDTQIAALKRGEIAGRVDGAERGFGQEDTGEGLILATAADFMPSLSYEIVLARKQFVEENPALTQTFINAFYETFAAMRQDKAKTVELSVKYMNITKTVAEKVYDLDMKMISQDGTWNQEALKNATIAAADLGLVEKVPSIDSVLTGKFVPAKFK